MVLYGAVRLAASGVWRRYHCSVAVYKNNRGHWVASVRFGGRGAPQVTRRFDPRNDEPIRNREHALQVEAWLRLERQRQEEAARQAEAMADGLPLEVGDLTLHELALQCYAQHWSTPGDEPGDERVPSPAYLAMYRPALRHRLIGNDETRAAQPGFPWLGAYKPRELRRAMLLRWKDAMIARGDGPRAINAAIDTAKTLVFWGMDRERCAGPNPFSRFPKVPEAQRDPVLLVDEEIAMVMAALPTVQDRAILAVICYLGTRITEAASLKRQGVRMDARRIRVWRRKTKREDDLPMMPALHAALAAHLETAPTSEWLFPAPTKPGVPIDVHNWRSRVFRRAVRKAAWDLAATGQPVPFDWDALVPRDFRNRIVSEVMAHKDGSLEIAGEIVGHSARWMTLRYGRALNRKREAVLRDLSQSE